MSDDDIQASLENCNKGMAQLVRDALQKENGRIALTALQIMLGGWLEYDCEIEAIKSVERTENERF
jgi:hypothetical protein